MDQQQNSTPSKLSTRYFPPNHAQMITAVRGHDTLNEQRQRSSFRRQEALYAVLVLIVLIVGLASLFVIAEAVK
jgi:hypothetical protein